MKNKFNLILIHPGIQYTYRLASALGEAQFFEQVSLYTWFTLSEHSVLAKFKLFKKRVKKIDVQVQLHNFLIFELVLVCYLKLLALLKINKGHTPRYQMQVLFAYFLLPIVYIKRKNTILVLSETAAWPLAYYAKKWQIPVILDFPSISHEAAQKAGIQETDYGKTIKTKERQYIDYAINCSAFAAHTYQGLTSAKKHYPIWLGAEATVQSFSINTPIKNKLHICCLANTEKRKGLDLLLLAFKELLVTNKKLYLVGKINKAWVDSFCKENEIDTVHIILTGAMPQQELASYLIEHQIDLHILASRFDSFGMVVPETMLLGIPNILSPYVGAGEMLEHGKNGYIMQNLSIEQLNVCIYQYLNLSVAAQQQFILDVQLKAQEMTWTSYNERVKMVFEEILGELKVGRVET